MDHKLKFAGQMALFAIGCFAIGKDPASLPFILAVGLEVWGLNYIYKSETDEKDGE